MEVKELKILMLHFFDCFLLLLIALSSPQLLFFFFFVYLKIKKKNLYKYRYVYKKGNFDYQAPLHSPFFLTKAARQSRAVSGVMPGAWAANFCVLFSDSVIGGSCAGAKRRLFFSRKCQPPDRGLVILKTSHIPNYVASKEIRATIASQRN
jgi:hypothetical protein